MYTSLNPAPTELQSLIDRFGQQKELAPLKARALKSFGPQLKLVYDLGVPWKAIWRRLREVGYQGSYRQFVSMAIHLTTGTQPKSPRTKTLPPPVGLRKVLLPVHQEVDCKSQQKEKPEWQIRREETMARLDREAEANREREARLLKPKRFTMTPFVGRGEE